MNPYLLCRMFCSYLLFARNKDAHLAESINHDIHVIMFSPRHKQSPNKIHGNVVPWSQRNWKWHVQTNLSFSWLACRTHHTSFNVLHNYFIHARPVTIALNLRHSLAYAKMSGNSRRMSFPNNMRPFCLWYAQLT